MSDHEGSPTIDPQRTDPEPHANPGPACPHCGGGPPTATPLGVVCPSCARVIYGVPGGAA